MPDPDPEQIGALARISCCVALRKEAELKRELEHALKSDISLLVLREVILQTYLFAGFAGAINAFIALNELAAKQFTAKQMEEFWQEKESSPEELRERGEELCKEIYVSQYEKLFHNMKQLHPDLADWMILEGYGKVLSRPFLSPLVRELLIVAMTAALEVERQFHSHVRGALNVGASPQQLRDVFDQIKPFLAEASFQRYQYILNGILRA